MLFSLNVIKSHFSVVKDWSMNVSLQKAFHEGRKTVFQCRIKSGILKIIFWVFFHAQAGLNLLPCNGHHVIGHPSAAFSKASVNIESMLTQA